MLSFIFGAFVGVVGITVISCCLVKKSKKEVAEESHKRECECGYWRNEAIKAQAKLGEIRIAMEKC